MAPVLYSILNLKVSLHFLELFPKRIQEIRCKMVTRLDEDIGKNYV
jgi:hypothetical protein